MQVFSGQSLEFEFLGFKGFISSAQEACISHYDTISVICFSDTHITKPTVPDGDILLHAGDLSQYGFFDEIQAQLDWLNAQSHRYNIIIAETHDLIPDEKFVKAYRDRETAKPRKSRTDL
ncbi:putative rhamnogalacturonate lyase C [Lachnellula hyalina]|uniref:Putative rhamnogalacturonate lyase C n=1 Tax=Lachnellula hyalina TaxID=1316788 RepID=A0A8H8U1J9_9HELO|nr:putative rhamnogalacturonate lyase C [Lachnellula hyalina]TVY30119.1 putative rhamnogalacturonate lyase C [Lachnellula hyalina]